VIRARAAQLRGAAAAQRTRWLNAQLGRPHRVLAERDGTGHAENFARVRLAARNFSRNNRDRHPHPYRTRPAGMSAETSWTDRLFGGLRKTSERLSENLSGIVSKTRLDEAQLDDIEDALILSDLGPRAARAHPRPAGRRAVRARRG
jgi:signal recognition particle GTPase